MTAYDVRVSNWSSDLCSTALAHHHDTHGDGTAGYHPHESPLWMLIPLVVLSIGAVFAGIAFHHQFIYPEEGMAFWKGSLAFDEHLMHAAHEVPLWVKWTPFTVMAIGLFLAWNSYIRNTTLPARFVAQFKLLHQFLYNKWYFDELYNRSEEHTSELQSLMRI